MGFLRVCPRLCLWCCLFCPAGQSEVGIGIWTTDLWLIMFPALPLLPLLLYPLLFLHRHQLVNFSLSTSQVIANVCYKPGNGKVIPELHCSVQNDYKWCHCLHIQMQCLSKRHKPAQEEQKHTLPITSLIDIHNHASNVCWYITSFQIVWFWKHIQTNFQCREIGLSKQDNIL